MKRHAPPARPGSALPDTVRTIENVFAACALGALYVLVIATVGDALGSDAAQPAPACVAPVSG